MAGHVVSDASLTAVADKIREKGGTSEQLTFPGGFVSAINDISGAGGTDPISTGTIVTQIGTITPASNSTYIYIDIDTSISTVLQTYGVIPNSEWSSYEGDPDYDNCIAGWHWSRPAVYFASNAGQVGHCFLFLSANANHHSYKTGNPSVTNHQLKVGISSTYKFIAGETYHYAITGVQVSA